MIAHRIIITRLHPPWSHMLTSIRLANFKSLQDTKKIQLRKFNLIFGPNSAGKSSLFQALLLLHHGFQTGNFNPSIITKRDQRVDLGGLLNVIRGHDPQQRISLDFTVEIKPLSTRQAILRAGQKRYFSWELELGIDKNQDGLVLSDTGGIQRCRVCENDAHIFTMEWVPIIESQELDNIGVRRILALTEFDAKKSTLMGRLLHAPLFRSNRRAYSLKEQEALVPLFLDAAMTDFAVTEQSMFQDTRHALWGEDTFFEYNPRHQMWEFIDPTEKDKQENQNIFSRSSGRNLRYVPKIAANHEQTKDVYATWWKYLNDEERLLPASEVGKLFIEYLHRSTEYRHLEHLLFDFSNATAEIRIHMSRAIDTLISRTKVALEHLEYLGPLRRLPDRRGSHGRGQQDKTDAWSVLLHDDQVRRQVNMWLGVQGLDTPYFLRKEVLYDREVVEGRQQLAFRSGVRIGTQWLTQALSDKLTDYGLSRTDFDDMLKSVASEVLEDTVPLANTTQCNLLNNEGLPPSNISNQQPQTSQNNIEVYQWLSEAVHAYIPISLNSNLHFAISHNSYSQVGVPVTTDLKLWDKRHNVAVSVPDVGTGISQVVPVLVHAEAENNKLLAIEQPELHLHPALQAELADTLITSAQKRQNTLLLETHSEHLMLRLLRRIRETTEKELPRQELSIRTDDVLILFAEQSELGSRFSEVHLTPEGDFDGQWPKGFFADRSKELM